MQSAKLRLVLAEMQPASGFAAHSQFHTSHRFISHVTGLLFAQPAALFAAPVSLKTSIFKEKTLHLAPHETDKLMLVTIGHLAQRRLARGLRLNYPEAIALISLVLLEMIRDGRHSVAELMHIGGTILGHREVMSGVAAMIEDVQVEGTFKDGTKLVAVRSPVNAEKGDMKLALYGSFLPVPEVFQDAEDIGVVGQVVCGEGEILLNASRETVTLSVINTDTRPVQVGSHYNFVEANPRLKFDREAAYGKRLDIPAGLAVRFEPGETKHVTLVEIAGNKIIRGGNNLVDGAVDEGNKARTLSRVSDRAFADSNTAE